MADSDTYIEEESGEQVKEFVYLGSLFVNDAKRDGDIERRVNAGNKMNGALLAIMNSKSFLQQARLFIHNGFLILKLLYGGESWVGQKQNESRVNVVVMQSLRNTCEVSMKDKCRNSNVRKQCGLKENDQSRKRYVAVV
ncbi:hypothetical protein EVAR_58011_1 [Eumeta japonica]|uniref:Uncharacterized protein n=1 Tax=Eumeta variegata TaxID=151549 RepID=A0A4C1YD10_EUMVA|nr:hypothetical protein EVAR_58011_1 [Eumeta japonica]